MSRLDLGGALLVFSQIDRATVDAAGWDRHALRFFRTRISLAEAASFAPPAPAQPLGGVAAADARARAALLVSPDGAHAGVRTVHGRARDAADLALAEAADAAQSGLALLARRCPTVWLVERDADDDPLALRLATILASALLGPILDARVPELLGVKSARARFER